MYLCVKVRRLEEVAQRNEEELSALSVDGKPVLLPSTTTTNPETGCENLQFGFRSAVSQTGCSPPGSVNSTPSNSASSTTEGSNSSAIQSEISALKARLAGTDQELQKTNSTLR